MTPEGRALLLRQARLHALRGELLALLPDDGLPMTVRALARAADCGEVEVTNALCEPCFTGIAGYDVSADAYFLNVDF